MAVAAAETASPWFAQVRQLSAPPPRRRDWRGLICLVLLSVAIRSPGLGRPLVGHFATKNATYAMIARNWALGRAPFWRPTTDCMAGGDRGWHLLEVPVAAYLAGAGWAICGGSLDVWGRAMSLAFSAASVVLIYLLVRRWHSRDAAYVAALVLVLSPVSIIFGQSFMLEASVVCLTLATLLVFDLWLAWQREGFGHPEGTRGSGCSNGMRVGLLVLAGTCFALLLLTKIYMLVLLLPLVEIAWRAAIAQASLTDDEARGTRRMTSLGRPVGRMAFMDDLGRTSYVVVGLGTMVLATLPAVGWCAAAIHAANPAYPESSHVFDSLYRSTTVHHWPHPLLASGAFYARLFYNLTMPALTPLAVMLALIGVTSRSGRRHLPWLAAMALLVATMPAKFYELQYYTLIVLPPLATLAGIGWECVKQRWRLPRTAVACGILMWIAISLRLSMGPAFATPDEDRAVGAAGDAVRELTALNEPVATLHGACSDLLYYCDRPGWALSTNDHYLLQKLEGCRRQGARWLVVADLKSLAASACADGLATLPVVREGDDYRVFRLVLCER